MPQNDTTLLVILNLSPHSSELRTSSAITCNKCHNKAGLEEKEETTSHLLCWRCLLLHMCLCPLRMLPATGYPTTRTQRRPGRQGGQRVTVWGRAVDQQDGTLQKRASGVCTRATRRRPVTWCPFSATFFLWRATRHVTPHGLSGLHCATGRLRYDRHVAPPAPRPPP